ASSASSAVQMNSLPRPPRCDAGLRLLPARQRPEVLVHERAVAGRHVVAAAGARAVDGGAAELAAQAELERLESLGDRLLRGEDVVGDVAERRPLERAPALEHHGELARA